MKKLILFLLFPVLFYSCKKEREDHAVIQRMLSETTTTSDSILIRQGEITLMPEIFAQGRIIGVGSTVHTLYQAGFTNTTAALAWPRTAKRYGTAINVNTMNMDWICHQEMFYLMEDYGSTYCESPGGKYYKLSNSAKPPKTWATNGRGSIRKFIINGNGSAYNSISTTDIVLFDVYPTDQNNAMTMLGNQYVFRDMMIVGNKSKAATNIGIRIGASTRPIFENIVVDNCGIGLDLQFCLETSLTNINVSTYGVYGVALRNGQWSGAANSNAQSNVVRVQNFRAYNGGGYTPIAAFYCNGNHTISGDLFTFEGDKGSQSHLFYENTGSTGVNVMNIRNIYMEYAGCTKAAIRVRAGKGQYIFDVIRSSVVESDMPCLIEVEAVSVGGNWGSIQMFVSGSSVDTNKGKFRNMGSSSYGVNWTVTDYNMKNNTTFNSGENFDTSTPGSYLPKSSDCRFTKPL